MKIKGFLEKLEDFLGKQDDFQKNVQDFLGEISEPNVIYRENLGHQCHRFAVLHCTKRSSWRFTVCMKKCTIVLTVLDKVILNFLLRISS